MNQVMALLWVGVGAVAIGAAITFHAGRSAGSTRPLRAGAATAVAFAVCVLGMLIPSVQALSTTIDHRRPVTVTCESALAELEGEPFLLTDEGRVFSPAHGACRAVAWERVARLGSAELLVGLLVGLRAATLPRRRANVDLDRLVST